LKEKEIETGGKDSDNQTTLFFQVFAWSAVPISEIIDSSVALPLYLATDSLSDEVIFQQLSNERELSKVLFHKQKFMNIFYSFIYSLI
jgi:hypothetical protein